ncbi:MAG TPA: hypothetical protein VGO48_04300 [Conexibacter sp.]|jgi:hypothetical protein|nr:hypothetical protein [Conexibacter sp.]
MTTKDIRTSNVQVTCDVCGRTLLRGEHSETYLAGGSRRQVCELCSARAVHEGWVREGVALERTTRSLGGERRRSLFGRLRRAGSGRAADDAPPPPSRPGSNGTSNGWHDGADEHDQQPQPPAEPRQVRAVPTSAEQRSVSAIERFNRSEHPRTVAGVARSLGAPVVVVRPAEEQGSLITIVVSWELCWYRYEVELSDGGAAVRLAGQGYELSEIPVEDRVEPNAAADEYGTLTPA